MIMVRTVGAVSKTIRLNILYSSDSRNCITWNKTKQRNQEKEAEHIFHVVLNIFNACILNKYTTIHALVIAMISSVPGGGVCNISSSLSSPNYNKRREC
jgi:hypothetical protein